MGDFGLKLEYGLRDLLKPAERGFQLAKLRGGGPVERCCFRCQTHIHGLPLDFVGEFVIRAMALFGIGAAGTIGFAALGHPLQYGSLAEVLQLIQAAFEFLEALGVFGQCARRWGETGS